MKKTATTMILALGCATTQAPAAEVASPGTGMWDEAAAQELRAEFEKMVGMWEAQDGEALEGLITDDGFLTSFDLDLENKPMRMPSREVAVRYVEEMFGQMKKMGGTLAIGQHALDCRATSAFGVCVMEFDFVATMPDGTKMTQPSRVTGAFRKGDDGWKWTHWHTSLAQLPSPPTPPTAPATPTMAPSSVSSKDLKWAPLPGVDGGEMAVVWENPVSHAMAVFFRTTKDIQAPRHFHTSNGALQVIKGEFAWTYPDGRSFAIKAGGFGFQPAREVHTTSIKKGSLFFYVSSDGPFDLVPVDEQGKPLPPPAK